MSLENNMDVDRPPPPEEAEQEVLVHPLAVVNMSDHYTRITCGGSPLPASAPVVGLLFGQHMDSSSNNSSSSNNEQQKTLHILDSNDIPPQQQQQQQQQLEAQEHPGVALHQAVFPQHEVVGWYRVVGATAAVAAQPTVEDLALTLQLQQQFKANIFCLLQAPSSSSSCSKTTNDSSSNKKPAAKGEKNRANEENDDDEEQALPLTLYCIAPNQKSLLAVEQWSLQSFPAERIATEHVIRSSSSNNNNGGTSGNNRSPFLEQTHHLQESWQTLSQKFQVLQDFLRDVATGALPHHPSLLRQVHQVMLGWPLAPPPSSSLSSQQQQTTTTTPPVSVGNMVQQLAVLTKTVDAVSSFTTKFRAVHDAANSSGSSSSATASRHHHHHHHTRRSAANKQRQPA